MSPTLAAGVFSVAGRLGNLSSTALRRIIARGREDQPDVAQRVEGIVERVRATGDQALRELAHDLDRVPLNVLESLESLEVPLRECDAALESMAPGQAQALRAAANAIRRVHEDLRPDARESRPAPGVVVGRRPVPLQRVGAYAPGGRAVYPSSVLMCAIPARVAGVSEVIVCSPPQPDGLPATAVRAACSLASVDRLFAIGGAGAIAAMAFGTESVPRVDKIVGPGNAYVEEAKSQLAQRVAIDSPAGPSELLVIADGSADPDAVVAELIAQAEHDCRAAVCLLTTDDNLVAELEPRLERQLAGLATTSTVRTALAARGAAIVCTSLEEALQLSEEYAPEHLLLLTEDASALAARVCRAGAVFIGGHSSVTFGDYASGSNHVLPTNGHARVRSGLSTDDFVRWVSWQSIDASAAPQLAATAETLAEMEGLPAHAAAARRHQPPMTAAANETAAPTPPQPTPPSERNALRSIRCYAPGDRNAEIELSDNTSRFGVAPGALEAVRNTPRETLRSYPSTYGGQLKVALAEELGIEPANVATGCGSDDLLDTTLRAFTEPGAVVAHAWPTFSVVPDFAIVNGARTCAVSSGISLTPDVDGLAAARAAVTYLCRPENPSGVLVPGADARSLAGRCAGLLIVDEAYIEFSGHESLAAWATTTSNVVVLRTFSKVAGLAGLRAGYAVGSTGLIETIEKARGPYKLNAVAESAAVAALGNREWRNDVVARTTRNRVLLAAALDKRRLRAWPSAANFLLIAAPDGVGADDLEAGLRDRGVGVRAFPGLGEVGDCVRVTVGRRSEIARFLEELDAVLAEIPAAVEPSS